MKTITSKGLLVTNDIIEKAQLGGFIRLLATDNLITLTKGEMTAKEIINVIDALSKVLDGYIEILKRSCGTCDDCGHCDDLDFDPIHLPDDILEIAGIPVGTKLSAFVEEDAGVIHIEPAEYDYDISDVSPELLSLLKENGICLGELDSLLMENEVL
ncbi:MAG: hypothetical protein RR423_01635 [Hydrogenoanaerobacterium sp.]